MSHTAEDLAAPGSTRIIPAAPNFYVVSLVVDIDGHAVDWHLSPVVGWIITELHFPKAGVRVTPIALNSQTEIGTLLYPDGRVVQASREFTSLRTWFESQRWR